MKKKFCAWLFRTWGWSFKGRHPRECKKYIIVVYPHTSNWDFPVGIILRCMVGADYKFLAKHSLFKPPYGWIFYALGGYPINRSKSKNFVDAVIDIFREKEEFAFTITPEGTRRKVDRLRTGFYYIALGAKVPLVLAKMDWGERIVEFSEPFFPSGDKETDFKYIMDFFSGALGKRPELMMDEAKALG